MVSEPPGPREPGASCVTARRPPCQPAGLETDPAAPAGSPRVASDAQVRRAAGLQGIRRVAAVAELGTVARSSPGAVLPGSCSGSLRIRPLPAPPAPRLPRLPRHPRSWRVCCCRASRQFLRARSPPRGSCGFYSASLSLLGGPSPALAFPRAVVIYPRPLFTLHRHLFSCQEPPSCIPPYPPPGPRFTFSF